MSNFSVVNLKDFFSSRLNQRIALSKIQKGKLAEIIGVSAGAISQFCSGASLPSADTLCKLANVLGVSSDYLLGLTDELLYPLADKPEGVLPYWIVLKDKAPPISGTFRYVYGIYPYEDRKFLYLDEQPGGTFIKNIIDSRSQSSFLSLTSLLNWELKYNYNPFNRENMDILFTFRDNNDNIETMSDGSRFNGLGIEKYRSIHLYSISPAYHDFLDQYLAKTTAEKTAFLRAIRMGATVDAE